MTPPYTRAGAGTVTDVDFQDPRSSIQERYIGEQEPDDGITQLRTISPRWPTASGVRNGARPVDPGLNQLWPAGDESMQYILLIYGDEQHVKDLGDVQRQRFFESFADYSAGLVASGKLVAASTLQPAATATTVCVREGKTMMTDGPFAETKEQLGGYFIIEANDLDDAIESAVRVPAAGWATVEIRPIMDCAAAARGESASI